MICLHTLLSQSMLPCCHLGPAGKARLPDGVTCVQVVAGDGFTFALSDAGAIYGWGQFKDDLSSFYSFGPGVKVQRLPALVYQPEVCCLDGS